MYQFFLKGHGDWSWLVSFLFVLCGALRLARFNVETKGPEKIGFQGSADSDGRRGIDQFRPVQPQPVFSQPSFHCSPITVSWCL